MQRKRSKDGYPEYDFGPRVPTRWKIAGLTLLALVAASLVAVAML